MNLFDSKVPRVQLQGGEDGGEWVAQLVGQGRQRLACWQRHRRGHRGITEHLTDLPFERMGVGHDSRPPGPRPLFFPSPAVLLSVAA